MGKPAMTKAKFEAIEVVGQSQQQGLEALCRQRAPRSPRRELAFDSGKDRLHQRPLPVVSLGKGVTHPISNAANAPGRFPSFGGDDARGAHDLTDVLMVSLAVKRCIGQDPPDGRSMRRCIDQRAERRTVVGGASLRGLCQDYLPIHVDGHQPLEPKAPGKALGPILRSLDEEGADGSWSQARPSTATVVPPGGGGGRRRMVSSKSWLTISSDSRRKK